MSGKILLFIMVLMIACAAPVFACNDCGISEKGSSFNVQTDQVDLVVMYAAVDSRSLEVIASASSERSGILASSEMKTSAILSLSTYRPGHDQFDYGPLLQKV